VVTHHRPFDLRFPRPSASPGRLWFSTWPQQLGGANTINRATVVIENAALGIVRYDWVSGNTADAGDFVAEFEVLNAGKVETYPNSGHINVVITPDIA